MTPVSRQCIRHLSTRTLNKYDAVIVGGGHNGLVAAAYLQKNGHKVCVLEKRPVVGGAAITEEIIPGFKFSRASYVLSLLRPQIFGDLKLKEFGLNVLQRNPSSYTPLSSDHWNGDVRSLTIGRDNEANQREIGKFSTKDAVSFLKYEALLNRLAIALDPLIDMSPHQALKAFEGSTFKRLTSIARDPALRNIAARFLELGTDCTALYELLTASPLKVLRSWFESEVLLATLAMDAVIGTMESPNAAGTGYVLLLHSMLGHCEGQRGRWGYPVGGMGAVSNAIAASAKSLGVEIFTDQTVEEILVDNNNVAKGVRTNSCQEIVGDIVLSCATPKVTFLDLLPKGTLDVKYESSIKAIDYSSGVTKINVAVNKLPNFIADPNYDSHTPMPHHQATIHLNNENVSRLVDAHDDAIAGNFSKRPLMEMVIPSILDDSIAPEGCHVCSLFTQYTPYSLKNRQWNDESREEYASTVFNNIEEYAPGFIDSIVGKEVLTPPDIEKTFGLTGGNIFHGSMSPDRLFLLRPTNHAVASPFTPIKNLLLCGSGAHPGGGVSGAPGRIAALEAITLLANR